MTATRPLPSDTSIKEAGTYVICSTPPGIEILFEWAATGNFGATILYRGPDGKLEPLRDEVTERVIDLKWKAGSRRLRVGCEGKLYLMVNLEKDTVIKIRHIRITNS